MTSIGGSPAIDVARCLRQDASVEIIGGDAGEWGRRIGETLCDRVVALPRADQAPDEFVAALQAWAADVDFIFIGLDSEIEVIATVGAQLGVESALAPVHILPTLLDKMATKRAANLGHAFPRTHDIAQPSDLDRIFAEEEVAPLWIRPQSGTSGQASLCVKTVDEARAWMQYWDTRVSGIRWMIQEFLPGRNLNWSGVYAHGELKAWGAMERLQYLLGNVAPSGVTGQVKLCATIADEKAQNISEQVIRSIDPSPHGIYSVDLRENVDGEPRVTEINPRLAGRPWLMANAGANLPLAALRALRGESVGNAVEADGLRAGVQLYRHVDIEPLLYEPG